MRYILTLVVLVGGCGGNDDDSGAAVIDVTIRDASLGFTATVDYTASAAFTADYVNSGHASGTAVISKAIAAFPGGDWDFLPFLEPKDSGVLEADATTSVVHQEGIFGDFTPYTVVPNCNGVPAAVPIHVTFDLPDGTSVTRSSDAAFTCQP